MSAEGWSELVGAPARQLLDDLKPLQRSAQQLLDAGERARGDLMGVQFSSCVPVVVGGCWPSCRSVNTVLA